MPVPDGASGFFEVTYLWDADFVLPVDYPADPLEHYCMRCGFKAPFEDLGISDLRANLWGWPATWDGGASYRFAILCGPSTSYVPVNSDGTPSEIPGNGCTAEVGRVELAEPLWLPTDDTLENMTAAERAVYAEGSV